MKNPTATLPVEKITIEFVDWHFVNDCGTTSDSYDITHWSPDQRRDLHAFLQSHGAVRTPAEIV
ncbi:hypothetical protein KIP69_08625 [Geobacter sulfurreducens]|uniref:hypothetical protein n=1 Tax=Geobacter sulfurreducens TaxID=35554 RepID=UPI0001D8F049|nr:hypothetical protein [Geobacter sulfurreducens]ADI84560.1 hypothetical protein KN400_1748 [Geobacter sulfurreducens KN400]QVW33679.1 hypothetical protein KIP69_08625 [Geobacter sulfurreducens]